MSRSLLRYFLILLAAALSASCVKDDPVYPGTYRPPVIEQDEETPPAPGDPTVYGKVSCDGSGIPGVVVSDGYEVTVTGEDGSYELVSAKKHGYVFISIPSGYEVQGKGVQPQFYSYVRKGVTDRCDFTLERVDQSEYTMLFFGDIHLAKRFNDVQQFRSFASDVNGYIAGHPDRPVYATTLGDMAWDIFWVSHSYNLNSYLQEMNLSFGDSLPVFHTIGNHDHEMNLDGDFACAAEFKRVLGPTYYSFNIGGVHYIVLDDMDCYNSSSGDRGCSAKVTDEQIAWLVKDISYVAKSTPVVVTCHAPLYNNSGNFSLRNGWNVIKNFDGYSNVHFVSGHTHIIYNVDRLSSGIRVFENNSGAVCGGWWMTGDLNGISLCGDGAPSGYRIMDVKNGKMDWRFKGTGLPESYQFRAYDRNELQLSAEKWVPDATAEGRRLFLETVGNYAYASSANEVLINVWDYDTSWKLSVTENGNPLPVTQLDDVKDPLYLVCYEAYEYEHHYDDTVYYPAYTTDHIFKVTCTSPSSTLVIKVTDRFGREYTRTMTRPREFSIEEYRSASLR